MIMAIVDFVDDHKSKLVIPARYFENAKSLSSEDTDNLSRDIVKTIKEQDPAMKDYDEDVLFK
jgi:hypothetical protein